MRVLYVVCLERVRKVQIAQNQIRTDGKRGIWNLSDKNAAAAALRFSRRK